MPSKIWSLPEIMAVLLCAALSGCGPAYAPQGNTKRSDLIGTYCVTYNQYAGVYLGKETLVLKPNSTFEQTFTPPHGSVRHNTGKWSWSRGPQGEYELNLDGLAEHLDPSRSGKVAAKPTRTNVFTGIHRRGNRIWLTIDEDEDLYYEKK